AHPAMPTTTAAVSIAEWAAETYRHHNTDELIALFVAQAAAEYAAYERLWSSGDSDFQDVADEASAHQMEIMHALIGRGLTVCDGCAYPDGTGHHWECRARPLAYPTLDGGEDALFDATPAPDLSRPIFAPFSGPGGMEVGARILGLDHLFAGYDLDKDAVATGRAAGFARTHADVRTLNPATFAHVTGAALAPPCPTWSNSGTRSALADLNELIDGADCLFTHRCGCLWQDLDKRVADPRTALALEPLRWAAGLPHLEWLVAELTPAARPLWEAFAEELYDGGPLVDMGWAYSDVVELDAADFGAASHRKRVLLLAHRTRYPDLRARPLTPRPGEFPRPTMAQALGWEPGHRVRTRGNRKSSGGNLFSADRAAWCLTEKARGWEREADRLRLTSAEAGLLVGMPYGHPWQGSRSKQFLQAANCISPMVAAAVLGTVLDIDWRPGVHAYLEDLYGQRTAA
ncbi:DNA cytosine methyltransferase, partial [Nonomuraea turkmeniaca]|uniref:DNA cytosine methyltransferase n=1 Tax=Nonomuraea turkmeniaca TaxID=103838 RepID=UPI001B8808E3